MQIALISVKLPFKKIKGKYFRFEQSANQKDNKEPLMEELINMNVLFWHQDHLQFCSNLHCIHQIFTVYYVQGPVIGTGDIVNKAKLYRAYVLIAE